MLEILEEIWSYEAVAGLGVPEQDLLSRNTFERGPAGYGAGKPQRRPRGGRSLGDDLRV